MTTERLRKYGCKIVSGDLILRKNSSTVEVFSSDTADAAYLCIHDVVLPLPGYDIVYPNNEIGTLYRQFLVDDCINFVKDSKIPEEGTAKGSYRHIVTTAINNEVQFSRMSSIQDEDVSVDCNGTPYNHNDIKFVFQLPKGSYATMFLRELMLTTVVRDQFNKSSETVT